MSKTKFAAFILTHGRADDVLTYDTLRRCGYTGKIYLLVDNEDSQAEKYVAKYGREVIIFDKTEAAKTVDTCDNQLRRDSVVYARNANFEIARRMGITHFLQLDDDYPRLYWAFNNRGEYQTTNNTVKLNFLDDIIAACVQFLDTTPAKTVCFAQAGDFIGGGDGSMRKFIDQKWFSRKAMNSFFFRTDRPVIFRGRVNDDVNLYVEGGRRGDLFATIPRLRVQQPATQTRDGGCTDVYKDFGTYIKSFYSVMVAPSCVSIRIFNGAVHPRIHHAVTWNNACPVILDEKYRKQS